MAKKKTKKPAKKAAKKSTKKKAAKRPAKKSAKKAAKKKPAKKKAAKNASKKPSAPVAKPTTAVNPYINFNGNCEEAFKFYQSVFGGKFGYVGRFSEMPPMDGKPIPAELGQKIMHISLPISKETSLMGSDAVEGFGPPLVVGTNFSVSINAVSKADADRLFNGLSAGGRIDMPIGDTFWGSYFGMFADKYGINWMVSFDKGPKK
ncbi:MAG: VOC family protein [Flavobacteriales bacterium]